MSTNDLMGLLKSGIPPEMAAQYQGLTREQAIMEAMLKQGMAPGGEAINAGKFIVRRSPLEGVAKILQAYMGAKGLQGTDAKIAELGSQYQQTQAQQMADYLKSRDTPAKPEITLPEDQAGPVREAIPAVVGGNAAAADIAGLSSTNPRVAAIAKILQAQTQKEAESAKLESGRNSRNQATIDAARSRLDVVPAGTQATIDAALKRLEMIPAGTQAQIDAIKELRAAMTKFYGTNTAAKAADTKYNTGIDVPGLPPGVSATPAPAQPALPPDGAATPSVATPAEKSAYDAVAANLAKGVTGSAPTGGAFTPSPTGVAAPLVPGLGGIQSPKARDAALAAAAKQDPNAKPMPAPIMKMQQDSLDAIGTAGAIKADLGEVTKMIDSGKLQLGPVQNLISRGRNVVGLSDESSKNFATFRATLEKLRNDSLRLNKGVQTEGDSVRAWNEILTDINDPQLVKQRLGEVQKINERAISLHEMQLEQLRANYGRQPLNIAPFAQQPAAIGSQSTTTPSGSLNYKGYRFPSQEALDRFKAAGG